MEHEHAAEFQKHIFFSGSDHDRSISEQPETPRSYKQNYVLLILYSHNYTLTYIFNKLTNIQFLVL